MMKNNYPEEVLENEIHRIAGNIDFYYFILGGRCNG